MWITHDHARLDVTLHSDDTQHAPQGLRKRRTARDDPLRSEAQAWRPPLAGCVSCCVGACARVRRITAAAHIFSAQAHTSSGSTGQFGVAMAQIVPKEAAQ